MIDLTNKNEIEDRLGRTLTATELDRMPSTIRDVSAYLRSVAPKIPNSLPIPDAVIGVASWLAIGGLVSNPEAAGGGIASEGLGGYQVSYREGGGSGTYSLTDAQLAALKPWAKSRIGVVQLDSAIAVAGGAW